VFEILGMLGHTLHINGSCFRLLPNPTMYRWDRKNFSLKAMLVAYEAMVIERGVLDNPRTVVITRIKEHIGKLLVELEQPLQKDDHTGLLSVRLLGILHDALDDMDEVLTARQKAPVTVPSTVVPERIVTQRSNFGRQESQNKMPDANVQALNSQDKLKEPKESPQEAQRKKMVQDVLRSHLQEVLQSINDRTDDEPQSAMTNRTAAGQMPLMLSIPTGVPRFEDIDAAAPEDKQLKFMEVYFKVILKRVTRQSITSTNRRLSIVPSTATTATPIVGIKRQGTAATYASIAEDEDEDRDSATPPKSSKESPKVEEVPEKEQKEEGSPRVLWNLDEVSHEDVWCVLVFRMICWLMLHDFNKKDVQISKSELLGSRLSVYIS